MEKVIGYIKESKLINNINPSNLNCYERPILIAQDSIRPYTLFLSLFCNKEAQTGLLSDTLTKKIEDIIGLEVKWNNGDGRIFFPIVKRLIDNNAFLILVVNLFYSKEHQYYYQKKHHAHFILLKGYNEEAGKYITVDETPSGINDLRADFNPYFEQLADMQKIREISLKISEVDDYGPFDKNSSYNNYFIYLTLINKSKEFKKYSIADVVDLYKEMILELRDNCKENENKIREKLLLFESSFNEKYSGLKSIYPIPEELQVIFKHADSLVIQQRIFELAIGSLSEYKKLDSLFSDNIKLFKKIISLLNKRIFSSDARITNRILSSYLCDFTSKETALYDEILELLRRIDFASHLEKASEVPEQSPNTNVVSEMGLSMKSNQSVTHIELFNYFNSRVFLDKDNPDKIKDSICNNERFLTNNSLNTDYLKVENVTFDISNIRKHNFDNISCNGELVSLPNGNYDSLMMLGFSEWGNFEDTINVNYQFSETEKIRIRFSNCENKSAYEGVIAWEGEKLQLGKNLFSKAYMFASVFPLKGDQTLKSVQLPNLPNLHLLAISLGKRL